MRLRQYVLLTGVLLSLTTQVHAEALGLGVIIGTETGFSFKYNMSESRAIDGAVSYATDRDLGTSLHADYLIDNARTLAAGTQLPLSFYYGIGLRLSDIRRGNNDGKTEAAVRAPFGLTHITTNPNLEFFGELVPALVVAPDSDVVVDAGIGIRYRF